MARGSELTNKERVEFTFEGVEYLLEDSNSSMALELIGTVQQLIAQMPDNANAISRFRHLLARCCKASAAFHRLYQAIDESLRSASSNEKQRLEAELTELHFLCGDLQRAANCSGLETS